VTGPLRRGRLRVPVLGAVRQPGFWGGGLGYVTYVSYVAYGFG